MWFIVDLTKSTENTITCYRQTSLVKCITNVLGSSPGMYILYLEQTDAVA